MNEVAAAPAWYRDNLLELLEFVATQYRDLLLAEEKSWLATVQSLDDAPQRLYARLLLRKPDRFRLNLLHWDDLTELEGPAQALKRAELIDFEPPQTEAQLLGYFSKAELRQKLKLSLPAHLKREELIEGIDSNTDLEVLRSGERWLRLHHKLLFERFKLFYFGNRWQDMDEFVRVALGQLDYEVIPLDRHSRAFASRRDFEHHWQYWDCRAAWEQLDQSDVTALIALERALPEAATGDWTLGRRLARLRNRIARALERLGANEAALQIYQRSDQAPSRERQLLLLERTEQHEAALSLCEQLLDKNTSDAEREAAERVGHRIRRARGQKTNHRVWRPATTCLTLKRGDQRVEVSAVQFYSRFGSCWHVENTLIRGVFGLFCWDIIYAPIAGAWFNPFQRMPMDFHDRRFHQRRAGAFAERMEELDDPLRFSARVFDCWESRYGRINPMVHWAALNETLLQQALSRIPAQHWRVCFERLLQDIEGNGSGMPDLVLFPHRGGYEFIEIKGPGDALQLHQRRWLAWFDQHRMPCRVVRVRWQSETVSS